MLVRKSYRYRLRLTKKRIKLLQFQLEECRWLYNELLSQRKLAFEELDIKKMIEKSSFAKSILDASWNQFLQFLTYKAAEAGRKLGLVDPAYTTQTCSRCGFQEAKKLSDRMHSCSRCGYKVSRDLNAAQNILALGLDGLGAIPRSPQL